MINPGRQTKTLRATYLKKEERGFTVAIIAMLFLAFSVMVTATLSKNIVHIDAKKTQKTATDIDEIVESLRSFQIANGYYPCPAARNEGPDAATFGEPTNCTVAAPAGTVDTGTIRIGALPVRTLGLKEKMAADEWDNKFLYAVTKNLTAAGTYGAGTGTISGEDGAGTSVVTPINTAKFVVLSHGKDGKGAYPLRGSAVKLPCGSTTKDSENCDDNDALFYQMGVQTQTGQSSAAFSDDVARGSWSLNTDDTPNAFNCASDIANANRSTNYTCSFVVTGFDVGLTATATGNAAEVSTDNVTFLSAVSVMPGNTVYARMASSGSFNTAVNTSISVGNTSDTWTVTTKQDDEPNAFSFIDQTGLAASTITTSNAVVLAGFTGPLTATGSAGVTVSRNGGAYGASVGGFMSGDTITVRMTSSASASGTVTGAVTVGATTSGTWTLTTGLDITPNPFNFLDITGAGLSAATSSAAVVVSGFDGSLTPSCTNGAQISVNGGAFVGCGSASVSAGNSLVLRLTSSASYSTAVSTTITLGGTSDGWSVTTANDTTPDAFDFVSQTEVALNTVIESNVVTVSGFSGTHTPSCSGSTTQLSLNGGAYALCAALTVSSGNTLRARMTSSSTITTGFTGTVTLGGVSDSWTITTTDLPASCFKASDAAANDHFGAAITKGGTYTAVGAPDDDNSGGSNAGSVYIFNGSTQVERLQASDAAANDNFGKAVAMSTDGLVLAIAGNSGVYIYIPGGTSYVFQQKIASAPTSVAAATNDGATAVVGFIDASTPRIYRRSGVTWSSESAQAAGASSGPNAIAISADAVLAAAGRPSVSGSGTVSIYQYNGVGWSLRTTVSSSDGYAGDGFGYAVALTHGGSILWAGANNAETGYGFIRSGLGVGMTYSQDSAFSLGADVYSLYGAESSTAKYGFGVPNAGTGGVVVKTTLGNPIVAPSDIAAGDMFGYSISNGYAGRPYDDHASGSDAGSVCTY